MAVFDRTENTIHFNTVYDKCKKKYKTADVRASFCSESQTVGQSRYSEWSSTSDWKYHVRMFIM